MCGEQDGQEAGRDWHRYQKRTGLPTHLEDPLGVEVCPGRLPDSVRLGGRGEDEKEVKGSWLL